MTTTNNIFNYPVKIFNISSSDKENFLGDPFVKGEIRSLEELKEKKSLDIELEFNRVEIVPMLGEVYVYDVWFDEDFSLHPKKSKLWAELAISFDNFKPSLDWINFSETTETCLLPKIIDKISKDLTPKQMEALTEEILNRPEESWIKYIESTILFHGVFEIFRTRHSLEINLFKDYNDEHMKNMLRCRPVINKYNFEDIDKYAYHCKSLVDKFLILTDGFNQCFMYNGENYSSVAVCEPSYRAERKYSVYIYGCDDSSYTKYCETKEEAIEEAEKLTKISSIITSYHMKELGYEFTN